MEFARRNRCLTESTWWMPLVSKRRWIIRHYRKSSTAANAVTGVDGYYEIRRALAYCQRMKGDWFIRKLCCVVFSYRSSRNETGYNQACLINVSNLFWAL